MDEGSTNPQWSSKSKSNDVKKLNAENIHIVCWEIDLWEKKYYLNQIENKNNNHIENEIAIFKKCWGEIDKL